MRENGIPVGLASDGPMSGNTLDMFAQFAPASMFAKLLGKSKKCRPAREVVLMATLEGARVLVLEQSMAILGPEFQVNSDLSNTHKMPVVAK